MQVYCVFCPYTTENLLVSKQKTKVTILNSYYYFKIHMHYIQNRYLIKYKVIQYYIAILNLLKKII